MTQVRFGGNEPRGYQAARWTYNLPQKAEAWLTPKLGQKVAGFTKNQLNTDFSHFTSVSLGKFKTMLADPPRLPLLLLLYPGTVGPRLYRAYQRGKENNDYREMGDVLRRDVTAITMFVFALAPLVNNTSKLVQKIKGVNLVNKDGGVLSYSDFRNYEIDSAKALWQLVKEGNGVGLKNAINNLKDQGLTEKHKALNPKITHNYADILKNLKREVSQFVEDFNPEKYKVADEKAEELAISKAEKVYKHFTEAEDAVFAALQEGGKKGSKEVMEIAKNLQGQAKGALKYYAKVHRLPADVLSFAVLVGLIGWAPMAFNAWWNKRQFEKQMSAAVNSIPPKPIPLPQPPVPQAITASTAFQPFMGFPPQRAANPFSRSV
jgi:gas vesicle protein